MAERPSTELRTKVVVALQQFTDGMNVFGNEGLSVIFRVLEDLVQFEMM